MPIIANAIANTQCKRTLMEISDIIVRMPGFKRNIGLYAALALAHTGSHSSHVAMCI